MVPIRVEAPGVEPVDLPGMRAWLRLPEDGTAEDPLVAALIPAARAAVESACGRLLTPGRYRMVLPAWPARGFVPVPLSPLVAVLRLGSLDARGAVSERDPGLAWPGDDPWDAPGLHFAPAPDAAGGAVLVEVAAGCGGEGPPVPAPLAQAVRLTVAAWFEHRGDGPAPQAGALPPAAAALAAVHRRLRL